MDPSSNCIYIYIYIYIFVTLISKNPHLDPTNMLSWLL